MEWRERESARFTSGQYAPVPWAGQLWYITSEEYKTHFAHVSEDDRNKLAYTPDDRFGREDRQLRTRPGKYLRKYFGTVLTEQEIQEWAQRWAELHADVTLRFARTPDEIEDVYTGAEGAGCGACMSHGTEEYSGPCHPVRVYGAGDLAIAYIGDAKHPKARVLTRNEPKIFGRIYGDAARIRGELERQGYTPDGSSDVGFSGAKLLRVEADPGLVVPYLDLGYMVTDHGTYLTMERRGQHEAQSTGGVILGYRYTCDRCGDGIVDEDDGMHCINEDTWCQDCYESYGFYCEDCGEGYDSENMVMLWDRHCLCESCADERSFVCEKCGEREENDSEVEVEGERWCKCCAENHAHLCEHCDEWKLTANSVGDEYWCDDCRHSDASYCEDCQSDFPESEVEGGKCESCRAGDTE